MHRIAIVALLALLLVGSGCSQTKLLNSWNDPGYSGQDVDCITVVGIGINVENRNHFEREFEKAFEERDNDAVSLHGTAPNLASKQVEPDSVGIFVGETGCDLVLTARIVGDESNTRFTEGGTYKLPATYYNELDTYYQVAYMDAQDSDRFNSARALILEANLYDTRTGKLVWAGRSLTAATGNLDARIRENADVITADLDERGFIR